MHGKESSQEVSDARSIRRKSEWHVGTRIIGPVLLLIALLLANAQWVRTGLDVAGLEPAPQRTSASAE